MGSITHIADAYGSLRQELSYDAWGRLRNPSTQAVYAPGSEPALLLGRGYTGHEHLTWFGLINMNARLYDPALGRFLSPDPYVQAPDFTQNFNRYSYALNNPLMFVDPDGEFSIGFLWGVVEWAFNGKPFKEAFTKGANDFMLVAGLFTSDKDKPFWGQVWEVISKHTWQLPQSSLGLAYNGLANSLGQIDKVRFEAGATVATGNNWGLRDSAVTLGSYISGGRNSLSADRNNDLFRHEYGHYLQSQKFGHLYLGTYGIPSLFSKETHRNHPAEQNANNRAFEYFNNKGYIGGDYSPWDERSYPMGEQMNPSWWDWLSLGTGYDLGLMGLINSFYKNNQY